MATTEKGIYYPDDYTKAADVPNDMKKMAESVDKAIDDSAYDDSEVKEDILELRQDLIVDENQIIEHTQQIFQLQQKNTLQDTEIEKLQYKLQQTQNALINETTEEATSLHVTDAAELPAKLDVRGNNSQETRSGKNLFDAGSNISDYFVTAGAQGKVITQYNAGDYVTCNIEAGIMYILSYNTNGYNWLAKWLDIDKNTNYTVSLARDATSLTVLGFTSQESGTEGTVIAELTTSTTFAIFNSGDYDYYAVSFYPKAANTEIAIQVEKGTEKTDFEQYGAMPSMDYPSEVRTVGASGSETITKINKNFFDIGTNWVTAYDNATRITDTAFTFADITVSDYKLESANYTTEQSYPSLAKKIKLAKNKDYYISCKDINSTLYLFRKNNNSEYGTQLAFLSANQKSAMFNSGGFDEYYWAFYPRSGAYFDHVQLEINSVATDFAGHEEESYTLSVQQEMLEGDYFTKEADGWKEVHTWNKNTYDETDNFSVYITDGEFQFYLPTTISQNATLLCNMFTQKNDWTSTSVVVSSNSQLYFLIKKGEYGFTADLTAEQALSKFKEIIATTNIVLYNTTAETKLACTAEQSAVLEQLNNLDMYKGTNNIITADNLALLKLTYTVDTKSYIDSKLENGV